MTIPLHDDLEEAIEATPTGARTFLITEYGKPFTADGFRNKMTEWRLGAGIDASVACHGMRKTVGIDMAENEATPYEIMAALGHTDPKVTRVYTEAADRRKLSGQAAAKTTLTASVKKWSNP